MCQMIVCFFFFNDTATTEIYTLSLHDALPISYILDGKEVNPKDVVGKSGKLKIKLQIINKDSHKVTVKGKEKTIYTPRSEEHTSELQSRQYLVCRLLLEKKKKHS